MEERNFPSSTPVPADPQAQAVDSLYGAQNSTPTDSPLVSQQESMTAVPDGMLAPSRLHRQPSSEVSPKVLLIIAGSIILIALVIAAFVLWPAPVKKTSTLQPTALPKASLAPKVATEKKLIIADEDFASPSPTPSSSPKASASPRPSVVPSVQPSSTPSPSAAPSPTDLSIDELQLEDPETGMTLSSPFYAAQRVVVRAKLRNLGPSDASTFSSSWKIQGVTMGTNSTGRLKSAATAVYDDVNSIVSPVFYLKQDANEISYQVDTSNVLKEANQANNVKSLTVSAGATRSDLEAVSITFYEQGTSTVVTAPAANQKLTAKAQIKNNGQDKQTQYSLRWFMNDNLVKETTVQGWVNPSNTIEETSGYDFTTQSGTHTLKFEVNTLAPFPETQTGNNSKTTTLSL